VDEERDNIALEDLFRQKLEGQEIEPSSSVSTQLMKRLGMKEFLRFYPDRFNLWYGILVAAAATTLAIILTSSPDNINGDPEQNQKVEITGNDKSGEELTNLPVVKEDSQEVKGSVERTSGGRNSKREKPVSTSDIRGGRDKSGTPIPAEEVRNLTAHGLTNDKNGDNSRLVVKIPKGNQIIASVSEGCAPLKVRFRCSFPSADSCRWSFGDGGFADAVNPEWLFDEPGEYVITLRVVLEKEISVSSVVIRVHEKPMAKFEITPEDAIIPQDEISFHNYSEGAVSYRWEFGDGEVSEIAEPRHYYNRYGKYSIRLIAISEEGCSDSLVVKDAFTKSGCFIKFPNAFIPNANGPTGGYYSQKSDESSHVFHPVFAGVAEFQLRIFSRFGIMVFETNDINLGWDGYYKGQLSEPGVYVWKVRGTYVTGEQFTLMGDLTLIKE
jgi:PKD repeat protein